jgi:hypothetical protein
MSRSVFTRRGMWHSCADADLRRCDSYSDNWMAKRETRSPRASGRGAGSLLRLHSNNIALRISVSPRELPADFVAREGVEQRYPFVARKILIAVVPRAEARDITILLNKLGIAPTGGTFEGRAAFSNLAAGVDVAPGRLRVEPFLPVGRAHAQTFTVDAIVRLGGAPFDQVVLTTAAPGTLLRKGPKLGQAIPDHMPRRLRAHNDVRARHAGRRVEQRSVSNVKVFAVAYERPGCRRMV